MFGNRRTWPVLGAVVVGALIVASPLLAASSPVSSALRAQFVKIDGPVVKASSAWTTGLSGVSPTASHATFAAAMNKLSPPYAAALKTFDKQLAALHLPGPAGSDAASVVKDDKQFEALLASGSGMSIPAFQKAFGVIFKEENALQASFRQAMGLGADVSFVI